MLPRSGEAVLDLGREVTVRVIEFQVDDQERDLESLRVRLQEAEETLVEIQRVGGWSDGETYPDD